jgi:hypothetical protein
MEKLDKKGVKDAADKAVALTEEVPEPFKEIAFKVIFENLLNRGMGTEKHLTTEKQIKPAESTPTQLHLPEVSNAGEGVSKIMTANFDWSKYNYIYKMEPYDQYLLVIQIARKEFEVDGLTPTEVRDILMEKFRITKRYEAISMALSSLRGKDVDRFQRGNGFAYRISFRGETRLQNNLNKLSEKE